MAKLIKADGTSSEIFPAERETGFDLDELYQLLTCNTVEMVELKPDQEPPYVAMLMDENGKLSIAKPTNFYATAIRAATFGLTSDDLIETGDHIVGDVILVTGPEFQ